MVNRKHPSTVKLLTNILDISISFRHYTDMSLHAYGKVNKNKKHIHSPILKLPIAQYFSYVEPKQKHYNNNIYIYRYKLNR